MKAQSFEKLPALRRLIGQAVADSLQRIQQHPFTVDATAQTLTRHQAERWILCAGRESRSFPKILENMIVRCANERIKALLAKNLQDEYGNGDPEQAHFRHYLQLLDLLSIPREHFNSYAERAGIKLALSLAYNISTQESEAVALGYMLVNESMTQITYAAAYKALSRYYPALQTPFFTEHVDIDAEHAEDLYAAIDELEQERSDELLFGINVGERGMAVLLDEAYGLFDHYDDMPSHALAG